MQGDSKMLDNTEDEVNYHYICLVRSHQSGRLFALDGDRASPIDRGAVLAPGDDVLAAGVRILCRSTSNRSKRT